MRELNKKINDMCRKSKAMRRLSWELDYESSLVLREQQDKVYKQFQFLKNMKKAIEKTEKEGKIWKQDILKIIKNTLIL